MQNTLSVMRIDEADLDSYIRKASANTATGRGSASSVVLPTFSKPHVVSDNYGQGVSRYNALSSVANAPKLPARPKLVPPIVPATPATKVRRSPLLVRANRALRTVLVALCGVAILGYGFDVAASHDVSKLQDQARRLNEQNSELSAQLLKSISYEGIQENVLGRFGLHTAEHVVVVKEIAPPKMPNFRPTKHQLPILAGY
jgi:hypothetical protein